MMSPNWSWMMILQMCRPPSWSPSSKRAFYWSRAETLLGSRLVAPCRKYRRYRRCYHLCQSERRWTKGVQGIGPTRGIGYRDDQDMSSHKSHEVHNQQARLSYKASTC